MWNTLSMKPVCTHRKPIFLQQRRIWPNMSMKSEAKVQNSCISLNVFMSCKIICANFKKIKVVQSIKIIQDSSGTLNLMEKSPKIGINEEISHWWNAKNFNNVTRQKIFVKSKNEEWNRRYLGSRWPLNIMYAYTWVTMVTLACM